MRLPTVAIAVLASLLSTPSLHAGPVHTWSDAWGDSLSQFLGAVQADPSGNVILCGSFYGTMTLDAPMTADGFRDMFVAKLDPDGNPLWSHKLGGTSVDTGWYAAVDASGNVIGAGSWGPTPDIRQALVVKYSPDGVQQWIKYYGDPLWDSYAEFVAADASGNVIVTGHFGGTVDFGGGPLTAAGDGDIFLVKLDGDGNHVWSKRFGTGDVTTLQGLGVDGLGNAVLFGGFEGTIDFGGGPLTSAGAGDYFLAKFHVTGAHFWSRRYGDTGYEFQGRLAVSGSGHIAIAGELHSPVDFGGGLLTPVGAPDVYLAYFTPGANHLWSKQFGDAERQGATGLTIASNGDVLLSCYGLGAMDFGGGALPATGTYYNMFLARFSDVGTFRWATAYAGGGAIYGMIDEHDGAILVAGTMGGGVDLGGGVLAHGGDNDVFAARFGDVVASAGGSPAATASLGQNVPNPFNPRTTISYSLDSARRVVIAIYDATGAVVARLDEGVRPAGEHAVEWNGRDRRGHAVASGVYLYRIEGLPEVAARKMVLLK